MKPLLLGLLLIPALLIAADDRIPFTDAEKQEFTRILTKAQAYERALSVLIQNFIATDPAAKQVNADFQEANTAVNAFLGSIKKEGYQLDLKDLSNPGFLKLESPPK